MVRIKGMALTMALGLILAALANWGLAGWNLALYLDKGHWYSLAVFFTSILSGVYSMIVSLRISK